MCGFGTYWLRTDDRHLETRIGNWNLSRSLHMIRWNKSMSFPLKELGLIGAPEPYTGRPF